MRIATWNCQTGLHSSSWAAVDALNADVITVQECLSDTCAQAERRGGWTCEWQQGRVRKGLAVLARHPYKIEKQERSEPCVISTLISGPGSNRFRFVGFWGMSPMGGDSYPQQATRLIEQLPGDGIPTVVAGDFNASSRNEHHLRNVDRFADLGLVSAYHSAEHIDHAGNWSHPTSYHHGREEERFHMDYVFVPKAWRRIQSVEVGTFRKYVQSGLSDHVPVVVTLRPE
jgi:endonuclease/exonuclease/phosphatase family metal-dependent hydrolase